jgi:hypothetical protein
MRRYYFDIRNEDDLTVDEEGLGLRDIEAVQEEAPGPWRTWPEMRSAELPVSGVIVWR